MSNWLIRACAATQYRHRWNLSSDSGSGSQYCVSEQRWLWVRQCRCAGLSETLLSALFRHVQHTVNFLNIRTPKKFVVITQIWTMWLYHRVMSPNDADGMANSVDPEQSVRTGISVRKLRIITVIIIAIICYAGNKACLVMLNSGPEWWIYLFTLKQP